MRLTICALLSLVCMSAPEAFTLPAPTGSYHVGTTSWHVTASSRREVFTDGKTAREVEVVAWYPTDVRTGTTAPYLRDSLAEVRTFASLLKPENAFDALAEVKTHAILDAAPRATGAKFPILLFSHGYTAAPSGYTAVLEDLASHGYAVLSVVHPYESTAATLANGNVVAMLDANGAFLPTTQAVFAEWGPEDATLAAVTRTADPTEQRARLRAYISKMPKTDLALRRWVDDELMVMSDVALWTGASTNARDRLTARIDLGRVGVFGHSMGGVTAAQVCAEARWCQAALNLDGSPQYGPMIDTKMPQGTSKPMLMVYSARDGRMGASDAIYRNAASKYIRVDVAGTKHLDFSDMTFWGGPLRARPILGTIAPDRVTDVTRTIVREYFDQEILGRPSPLLNGRVRMAEVTVR